jgi:signal transduction histidine kinase
MLSSGARRWRVSSTCVWKKLSQTPSFEDCCQAAQALADPEDVQLTWETSEDISFRGDGELLKRMAVSLLDNAIRHTQSGGL